MCIHSACTNPHPRFLLHAQGTLDYVLYTTDSLRPVGLLELPDEAELRKATGLPNDAWSSDHVALMAQFALVR